jgi:PIN domain nuclease of toxin-antitoxin system
MKLLLDTHTFIWWDSEPRRLSERAAAALMDPANELWVSVTSVWEMQIKHQLGKLMLRMALADILGHQRTTNGIQLLPIVEDHVFGLDALPPAHKDPFDRLLVAQANAEQASLVSADPVFAAYPVRVVW